MNNALGCKSIQYWKDTLNLQPKSTVHPVIRSCMCRYRSSDNDRLRLAFLFDYCFEAGHRPPTSRQQLPLLDAAWWRSWINRGGSVVLLIWGTGGHGLLSSFLKMWQNHFDYEFLRRPLSLFWSKKVTPRWQNVTPYWRKLASFASAVQSKWQSTDRTNLAN